MLPKQYRLPLRHQSTFFTQARKSHTKHLVVYSLPCGHDDQAFVTQKQDARSLSECTNARAAVIVPAKKNALAVDRNRIKRQVRAVLLPLLQATKTPTDYVVYVKRTFSSQDFPLINQELVQGLR